MPPCRPLDRRLLELVQTGIPLLREPYAQVAAQLGCDEQAVLDRLAGMRAADGVIREISGIFDLAAMGYSQALVALAVDEDSMDRAAAVVSGHPGVSHCYSRCGRYNLWFTLATSGRSKLGVAQTAAILARQAGGSPHVHLPAKKRYKLDVRFANEAEDSMAAPRGDPVPGDPPQASRQHLTDEQVRAARALQADLPNRPDPFAPLAASADMPADMLLVHAADLLAAGYMRRYAAAVHHRRLGAEANVLVAWRLAGRSPDAAGLSCARHHAVSHCYLRAAAENWPYELYTMIHGHDRTHCQRTIADIAAATGLSDRAELWTGQEYKKRRIPLFTDQEAAWESAAGQRE